MTIQPTSRQFSLRPESELLVWCARTVVTDALKERIRQRVQEALDWGVVLELAWYHGVGPLLYRSLSTLCSDLVPAESLARLRQRTQAGALLNRVLAQELVVLCEAFDAHGVPVMPIKGATLAVSAYGDLTLRDFSDLDLLVPKGSIAEAQAVLLAQGYERRNPSSEPGETDHEGGPYHVFIKKRTLFRVDLQSVMAHQALCVSVGSSRVLAASNSCSSSEQDRTRIGAGRSVDCSVCPWVEARMGTAQMGVRCRRATSRTR